MMRYHLSPALRQTKPQWADKLLESGACMRVKVDWTPTERTGDTITIAAISPLIVQVVTEGDSVEVRVKVGILISIAG